MVSRSTRNYKGRKPIAVFGQFILPIAVIIAIALLYFSIKLFFLTPSASRTNSTASIPAAAVTVTAPATSAAVSADVPKPPETDNAAKPKIVAGPVTQTSGQAASKPVEKPKTQPAGQTAPKPSEMPKTQQPAAKPAETPKTQPPAVKPSTPAGAQRFDVQIGAFTSKENALQLIQKARGQGYEVYVNEAVQDGSPYFRVRVKGPAERPAAQALSSKLQEQGYPVYIVPIN